MRERVLVSTIRGGLRQPSHRCRTTSMAAASLSQGKRWPVASHFHGWRSQWPEIRAAVENCGTRSRPSPGNCLALSPRELWRSPVTLGPPAKAIGGVDAGLVGSQDQWPQRHPSTWRRGRRRNLDFPYTGLLDATQLESRCQHYLARIGLATNGSGSEWRQSLPQLYIDNTCPMS